MILTPISQKNATAFIIIGDRDYYKIFWKIL